MKVNKFLGVYALEIAAAVGGLVAINLVFLADAFQGPKLDAVNAGQLGDFVGGYIGTALALFSVILLVSTLRKQMADSAVTEFSEKYFLMLRIHRDNVAEIGIGKSFGRKVFVTLIREFRAILDVVRQVDLTRGSALTQRDRLVVAYLVLFFGTGPNSTRMLRAALDGFDKEVVQSLLIALDDEDFPKRTMVTYKLRHVPFEGHQSRLGHYYRHLFQAVNFVHQTKTPVDKYEYVKTLRAQLSTHEQALLLLNSLTPMGSAWWSDGLIVNYRLAKNIPQNFFNPDDELDAEGLFDSNYFEFQRAPSRG